MLMYIAGNKLKNRLWFRAISPTVGIVKGPFGTRFYDASRFDRQAAFADYRNAFLAR